MLHHATTRQPDMRNMPLRKPFIAFVTSTSLLLSGCSAVAEDIPHTSVPRVTTVEPSPSGSVEQTAQMPAVPIPSNPSPTTKQTDHTPKTKLRLPVSAYKAPDGSVQGVTARFRNVAKAEVNAMEHCGNETPKILLTFDDSGSKKNILAIEKVLEDKGVGAIFFPNTDFVSSATIQHLRDHGFWVGNHTGSHPNLVGLTDRAKKKAILSGGDATLFRPPYGGGYHERNGYIHFDDSIRQMAERLGTRICLWTVDTNDWQLPSVKVLQKRIFDNLREGQVVLMHMTDRSNSLEALPGIIDGIRKRGYELCSLPTEPTTSDIPVSLPC